MRNRDNYWIRRAGSSRLSRRRFVGTSGALGIGAAGFALVGCGDDDDDAGPASPDATGSPDNGANGEASPSPAGANGNGQAQRGGVPKFSSANNTWDTFDADRSRFTPFAGILGLTNLGIVHYANFADAVLEGGFAESWETPDETTMTFTLREGLTWHDKPPVGGRAATADDMAFFINRNKQGTLVDGSEDPNFFRTPDYATVETAEAVDERTVRVTFNQPNPFFLATLAGSYAKVQAPEAVAEFEDRYSELRAEFIIGTGPFILSEFSPDGAYSLVRYEDYWRPANWDGVDYVALFTDPAAQQAAFEQKQIDAFAPTANDILDQLLSQYSDQMYNTPELAANPQAGTYYGGSPPWNDERLIGAIFRALDRHAYIQQIVEGRAAPSGNVPPAQGAFALPESELVTFPGYRLPEEKEQDITEARQMWEAADGASLGEIIVDIPDIYEGLYSGVSSIILEMLNGSLGTDQFTTRVETYAVINNKVSNQGYGNGANNIWYGWISDLQKLEPTPDLYRLYNSGQVQFQQFGVEIPEVDSLTDEAIVEMDVDRRVELCHEIQRHLLEHNGAGIPHTLLQFSNVLRWNYYHTSESAAFVDTHLYAKDAWFDQDDPTWQDRPS